MNIILRVICRDKSHIIFKVLEKNKIGIYFKSKITRNKVYYIIIDFIYNIDLFVIGDDYRLKYW